MLALTRRSSACAIALAVVALAVLVPLRNELRAQIKVSTQTVPLYVTVTDSTGRLVRDWCRRTSRSTTTASCKR